MVVWVKKMLLNCFGIHSMLPVFRSLTCNTFTWVAREAHCSTGLECHGGRTVSSSVLERTFRNMYLLFNKVVDPMKSRSHLFLGVWLSKLGAWGLQVLNDFVSEVQIYYRCAEPKTSRPKRNRWFIDICSNLYPLLIFFCSVLTLICMSSVCRLFLIFLSLASKFRRWNRSRLFQFESVFLLIFSCLELGKTCYNWKVESSLKQRRHRFLLQGLHL